uniref:Uncharacterized protein n=1 Tax=Picea glauca TaxID=3330 RepID=A0A117NIL0_PICGL|nr:hypothetical protein ABT39_MTgene3290 [Picea glauca]
MSLKHRVYCFGVMSFHSIMSLLGFQYPLNLHSAEGIKATIYIILWRGYMYIVSVFPSIAL